MEKQKITLLKNVNVDTMLSLVGEFGPHQLLVEFWLCIIFLYRTFSLYLMYFAALNPSWRCVNNSSICITNDTKENGNTERCSMPRDDWEFVEAETYSIVTQFDIYCNNEWQMHMATSIFFVGSIIGAITNGWLADRFGRKPILFANLFILLVFGLINAFMPNIYLFLLCRFILGLANAGVMITYVVATEMVGNKFRPVTGTVLYIFHSLAMCLLGLKAYLVRQWRNLLIICSAPYFIVLFLWFLIPESVRWLQVHGKTEKAEIIFKNIAKQNKKEYPKNISVSVPNTDNICNKPSLMDLFQTRKSIISNFILGLNWFVISIVYLGISLAADDLGGSLYTNFVLVSAIQIPAGVFAIYLCNRIGRKKTTMIATIIGGIACFLVSFIPVQGSAKIGRIALGVFGNLCITISYDSIFTWSVELFPTTHRGIGVSFVDVMGRSGGVFAPWIAKGLKSFNKTVPFIVMGSSAVVGASFLVYLPETKEKITCETTQDNDNVNNVIS